MPLAHSSSRGRRLAAAKRRTQRLAERVRRVASRRRGRQRRILAGVDARLSLQEISPLELLASWDVPAASLDIARELLSERGALLVLRLEEVPPVRPIPGQGALWYLEDVVAETSGSRRIDLAHGVGLVRGQIGLRTSRGQVLLLGANGPSRLEGRTGVVVTELPQPVATAVAVVEEEETEASESEPSGAESAQPAPRVLPWVGFGVQGRPVPERSASAPENASPADGAALGESSPSFGGHHGAIADVLGIAIAAEESSPTSSWGAPSAAGAVQLDLHAEVVVWGRAPAGLRVWVSGVEVPVRTDGSFEVRFAMPRSSLTS